MFLDPAHRAVPLGLALANLPACEGILNVLHHLFIFAPRDHKPLSFCQKQAAGDKAYKACGSGDGEGGHVRQKLPQGQPAKPPCFFFFFLFPLYLVPLFMPGTWSTVILAKLFCSGDTSPLFIPRQGENGPLPSHLGESGSQCP